MLITLCQFSSSPDRSFILKNNKFAIFANKK